MGSFNDTCAISDLAIREGDECVIMYIFQSHFFMPDIQCNPWSQYAVCGYPYIGYYDDYGGYDIKNENQIGLQATLAFFKENAQKTDLATVTNGRGGEVDPEKFDYQMLQDSISEAHLKIKQPMGPWVHVHRIAMHKKMYDLAIKLGKDVNSWRKDNFPTLKEFQENFVTFKEYWDTRETNPDIQKKWFGKDDFMRFRMGYDCETHHVGMSSENLAKVMPEDRVELHKFLKKHRLFMQFMRATNKTFTPRQSCGQDTHFDRQIVFNEAVIELAKKLEKRWDEENEEYGD